MVRAAADVSFESSLVMEEFAEANLFSTHALPHYAKRILNKGGGKL